MAGHLVRSVLLCAAVAADSDACARSGGDACEAVDHSLLQVTSRPQHAKKAPGLAQIESADATNPVKNPGENRTIANLTGLIEKELEDIEADTNLLVFGQGKLCGMATHHEARVETLKKILEVEAGQKTGAHMKVRNSKAAAGLKGQGGGSPRRRGDGRRQVTPAIHLGNPVCQCKRADFTSYDIECGSPADVDCQKALSVAPFWRTRAMRNAEAAADLKDHNPQHTKYTVGENVGYWSEKEGRWLNRKVKAVDGDNHYDLNYKRSRTVDSAQIRPAMVDAGEKGAAGLLQEEKDEEEEKDPVMATAIAQYGPNDFPTEKMVTNRSLDNITVDVQDDVHWVEAVLGAIGDEKDRIEVVGTDVKQRIKALVTLLTMETGQCQAGGLYKPGESHYRPTEVDQIMVQTKDEGKQSGEAKAKGGQQTQAMAQAEEGPAADEEAHSEEAGDAGQEGGDFDKDGDDSNEPLVLLEGEDSNEPLVLLEKDGEPLTLLAENTADDRAQVLSEIVEFPGWNLTLVNITTSLLADLTILEDDLAALVDMKNNVRIASEWHEEHMENLAEDTAAYDPLSDIHSRRRRWSQNGPGQNLLQTDKDEHQGNEQHRGQNEEQKERRSMARDERAELTEEIGKADHELKKKMGQAKRQVAPVSQKLPISNSTIANATNGIDAEITSLEFDMGVISKEKRMVCLATAKFLERLQTIQKVLTTLEC